MCQLRGEISRSNLHRVEWHLSRLIADLSGALGIRLSDIVGLTFYTILHLSSKWRYGD